MSDTVYPASLDTFVDPAGTDDVSVVDHALNHRKANDALAALEAKVGITSSANTASLDYVVQNTGSINPGHHHSQLFTTNNSGAVITIDAGGNVAVAGFMEVTGAGEITRFTAGASGSPYISFFQGSNLRGYLQYANADTSIRFSISNGIIAFYTGTGVETEKMRIGTGGLVRMSAYGAGTATFDSSGNITAVSDERLKNIQGPFPVGLKEILQINPILYKWNKDAGFDQDNTYAGFSAQNVMKWIPEAVGSREGKYSLAERPIVAGLVNAVKELESEISILRTALGIPQPDHSIPIADPVRIIVSKPPPPSDLALTPNV